MNYLFTLCGRAGSKGVTNKNIREMNGVPLPYYTLAAVFLFKKAHPQDEITVALNTDSEELVMLIRRQRAMPDIRIVERRAYQAGDRTAKVDVIQDTYLHCCKDTGRSFDMVIDLDLTSPMRRLEDIEHAVEIFRSDLASDLVCSVVPARRSPYFNMVEERGDYYRKICQSDYTSRQQAPKAYELNASIYVYSPSFLESEIDKTILEYRCKIVQMPDYLVLDIDSERDFTLMSHMMEYFKTEDRELERVIEAARRLYEAAQVQEEMKFNLTGGGAV